MRVLSILLVEHKDEMIWDLTAFGFFSGVWMHPKVFGLDPGHTVFENPASLGRGIRKAVLGDLNQVCRSSGVFLAGQAVLLPGFWLHNLSPEFLFIFLLEPVLPVSHPEVKES